jgi:hypothetical protein
MEAKIEKKEELMTEAGYTKADHLLPKISVEEAMRRRVGPYIANLLVSKSQGVPVSHYASLVGKTHEDKIVSRGRGGMTPLVGVAMDVHPHAPKKGVKLPDQGETM